MSKIDFKNQIVVIFYPAYSSQPKCTKGFDVFRQLFSQFFHEGTVSRKDHHCFLRNAQWGHANTTISLLQLTTTWNPQQLYGYILHCSRNLQILSINLKKISFFFKLKITKLPFVIYWPLPKILKIPNNGLTNLPKKVATFWIKDHTSGHSPCHYYLPESLIFLIGKDLNLSAQKL